MKVQANAIEANEIEANEIQAIEIEAKHMKVHKKIATAFPLFFFSDTSYRSIRLNRWLL